MRTLIEFAWILPGNLHLPNTHSLKVVAETSGDSAQYLRRLLREGLLEGAKIGQVWLIEMVSLDMYLRNS
jgi:hypothetical protein